MSASRGAPDAAGAGRIGPNAIIQIAAALRARVGDGRALAVLSGATGRGFGDLPSEMVDEAEVNRLVRAVRAELDPALSAAVLRDAGVRTADYLIANRIPSAAQWLMRTLPPSIGLRVLVAGIMRHTWTFAGSAEVVVERPRGATVTLAMTHCPMCRAVRSNEPACHFYVGTFERLLQRLIMPSARLDEESCEAMGDAACRFALRLH